MKKQLIFSAIIFFNILMFGMEEREHELVSCELVSCELVSHELDWAGSRLSDNLNTKLLAKKNLQLDEINDQSIFGKLPDEVIAYIFSFLVEDSCARSSDPSQKLVNIFQQS